VPGVPNGRSGRCAWIAATPASSIPCTVLGRMRQELHELPFAELARHAPVDIGMSVPSCMASRAAAGYPAVTLARRLKPRRSSRNARSIPSVVCHMERATKIRMAAKVLLAKYGKAAPRIARIRALRSARNRDNVSAGTWNAIARSLTSMASRIPIDG
jgi:hypothetical protein